MEEDDSSRMERPLLKKLPLDDEDDLRCIRCSMFSVAVLWLIIWIISKNSIIVRTTAPNSMESENDNGGSGVHTEYNIPPRQLIQFFQRERKSCTASGKRNGKARRSSVGSDVSTSSGVVRKKRCRETDNARKDSPVNKEDEPGDGGILSRAMEEELQQLTQKMDCFTHQVLGLLETGKACFEDASTAFEERVLQLHQRILQTWEEEIEGLRNVDIANEELCTRLHEARIALKKLQASATKVRRLSALSN